MNIFKKKNQEFIITPEEVEKNINLLKDASMHLWPHPNHDVEFVVPLFNAKKHYKHLKRMMWKYGKRY